MSLFKRIIFAFISVCVAVFLVCSPVYIFQALGENKYREWLEVKPEPYSGIITLWHIVGFKPYEGSAGSWLIKRTKKFEKKYNGVFIEVLSMTEEEAAQRLDRGEKPDMYSFALGWSYPERFVPLENFDYPFIGNLKSCGYANGSCYAVPFMLSGYLLLVNVELAQERSLPLPKKPEDISPQWLAEAQKTLTFSRGKKKAQIAGLAASPEIAAYTGAGAETADPEAFKSKQAAMAIADLRFAGDVSRSLEEGNGFLFEAYPVTSYTNLVQLIGISRDIDEREAAYANVFIDMLLGEQAQASLAEIGALPVIELSGETEKPAAPGLSAMLAPCMAEPVVPNAFLYQRYKTALTEAALRALKGDEAGRTEFDERVKELVKPGPME